VGVGEGIAGFSLSLPDMPVPLSVSVFLLSAAAPDALGFPVSRTAIRTIGTP